MGWYEFVTKQLLHDHLISPDDLAFVKVTDSVDEAIREFCGFYRNFHSIRYVGRRLVVRMQQVPSVELIDDLNHEFADIVRAGTIAPAPAANVEIRDDDHVDLPRLSFEFDPRGHGRLRQLIDRLNAFEPQSF